MLLHRDAREYWTINLTTEPDTQTPIAEADFGNGQWTAGQPSQPDTWRWLIQGPDAEPTDTQAVTITRSVVPRIRIPLGPEHIIRDATNNPIQLTP